MRRTIMDNSGAVSLEEVPDPDLVHDDDAIVRIAASCVSGSDLHGYHGG
jgi:threonine dehydrogenase-like Zn-dependent dehydrogenase